MDPESAGRFGRSSGNWKDCVTPRVRGIEVFKDHLIENGGIEQSSLTSVFLLNVRQGFASGGSPDDVSKSSTSTGAHCKGR